MEESTGGSSAEGGRMSMSLSAGCSFAIRSVSASAGGGGDAGLPLRWQSSWWQTRVAVDRRPTLERASIRAREVSGFNGRAPSS